MACCHVYAQSKDELNDVSVFIVSLPYCEPADNGDANLFIRERSRTMKARGFTLVELLVVIAIIALLMGILMPALSRVRQLAFRLTCGTNLAGIGKACLIYANDYEDEFPKAGGRTNTWIRGLDNWALDPDTDNVHDRVYNVSGPSGEVTVSSSLYLLVKYAEVTPKQFVCKGESEVSEFEIEEWIEDGQVPRSVTLTDLWDFGKYVDEAKNSTKYCSYAYHHPFGQYALTVASDPGMAVAADRNPWLADPAGAIKRFEDFIPDIGKDGGTADQAMVGNSDAHQREGQNVLFLDTHVNFEKRAFCAINNDNIYTIAGTSSQDNARVVGRIPILGADAKATLQKQDSVLMQDNGQESGGHRDPR